MKKVLSIAGSDCSGGAGIQADLKTMTAFGVYGMTAITALTAQNTTGVYAVEESAPDFVAKQLDCVFEDIFPDAVKIGMVSSSAIIDVIAAKLREYNAKNIVLDPVMVATSGGVLMKSDATKALAEKLFPLAAVITPNIPEAEVLSGLKISDKKDMLAAARKLAVQTPAAILLKGGHLAESADDLLLCNNEEFWFSAPHIETKNTHGTGCTLSSAIACLLAEGEELPQAVEHAKAYLWQAIKNEPSLGSGNGPINHIWQKNNSFGK